MELAVVGATGLCASSFIKVALAKNEASKLYSFSRKKLSVSPPISDKLEEIVSGDIDEWEKRIPTPSSDNSLFFSGIATTRAAAGGLDKQKLIDHDLQLRLAKVALSKGYKTFVLISSAGANPNSFMGYLKMKGETEEDIKKLGFERTLILRPGPLLGREGSHSGFGTSVMEAVLPHFYRSWLQSWIKYPNYADDVGLATLKLAKTAPPGVNVVEAKEILDLAQ